MWTRYLPQVRKAIHDVYFEQVLLMRKLMRKWLALGAILLLLSSCGVEWLDRLPYAGPVEISIDQGKFLPGTEIQYLGKTEDGAQVSIDGKLANKKIGDSLDWKADMASGVSVDQTLRVALISEDTLYTAGTVRVIVDNPRPQPEPVNSAAPVSFGLPVGYHVEKGKAIPGTTITYLGKTELGAHLGNIEGYAYRKLGDSITWEGRLRPDIWLELDLRTVLITENQLDVVGTVDLWITPTGP